MLRHYLTNQGEVWSVNIKHRNLGGKPSASELLPTITVKGFGVSGDLGVVDEKYGPTLS